ncbi:para-aminobenzoate synthetase/4-amino-4-deoxychorismate lyase [Massilia sp. UYP32]|uniref:Aminodeoxychorismate synthase, component I n=1 Tax=Massilia timonae CCUG 45783 TaxID=883126 RepID=K9DH63_9BURK|nr:MULTISPECIES: aminodeoxychorismate synthase component I [Massilia]EKU84089.1 aminodeoxychorismate synthase, component I [Massilia timonae CCUG 45783]QYG00399.1 aminodeoxychorismate synthase component I [Massilia sp. NP310]
MDTGEVFALLDDARATQEARSRLYSGHAGTLTCEDAAGWPRLVAALSQALQSGLHAVPLLSYELGAHLEGLPARPLDGPLAQVLLFTRCERMTGEQVASWLATRSMDLAPAGVAGITANVDEARFTEAIGRIRDYIAAGDTYQVNYTWRLRFEAFGSLLALYTRLRARQPVPYGALVTLPGGGAVLSFSPELFVRHEAGMLVARPMKGTAPASGDADVDAARAASLAQDSKNRAENLMIVDLLRNDLGRVAQTGSVETPALFEVQRYGAVLQMTSTVQARLRADAGLEEIFKALYPCGSITGAPKRRTMEIIHELEPDARGIYTGAIGWFDPAPPGRAFGDFCLSVPIRTLALGPSIDGARRGELGVGAGIVYDSDAQSEYAECQLKAGFLTGLPNEFEIFETIRASREHGCRHLEQHLDRMEASCAWFGFAFDRGAAHIALLEASLALPSDALHRLRLAVSHDGALTLTSGELTPLHEPVTLLLAQEPTHSGDVFLRHKTSVRGRYDAAWKAAEAQGAFDMLFFNERGELTEGGRCSVFLRFGEEWLTPPLSCGVLPGVMRGVLLAAPAWRAREAVITRAMLEQADDIVVCNALRGPLRAVLAA